VTITPDYDAGEAGSCVLAKKWVESIQWDNGSRLRAYACQAAAGAVALSIHRERRLSLDQLREQNPHDWGLIVDSAFSLLGPNPDAELFYRRTLARAERILRREWKAVQALAEALLRQKTLDAAAVRRIVPRR
jgi:hypothetical protein